MIHMLGIVMTKEAEEVKADIHNELGEAGVTHYQLTGEMNII